MLIRRFEVSKLSTRLNKRYISEWDWIHIMLVHWSVDFYSRHPVVAMLASKQNTNTWARYSVWEQRDRLLSITFCFDECGTKTSACTRLNNSFLDKQWRGADVSSLIETSLSERELYVLRGKSLWELKFVLGCFWRIRRIVLSSFLSGTLVGSLFDHFVLPRASCHNLAILRRCAQYGH